MRQRLDGAIKAMTNATLWIEITIAGAIYLVAILLWVLALLGPTDARLDSLRGGEFLPYLSVAFVAASYIVGIVTHRIVQIFAPPLLRRVGGFLHIEDLSYDIGSEEDLVRIWQYGSERLHREIDFQYTLVALIRSLLFSIPLLGTGVAVWLFLRGQKGTWEVVGLTLVIWALCFLAYRHQWQRYCEIGKVAIRALEPLERNAIHPKTTGEIVEQLVKSQPAPSNPAAQPDGSAAG